MCVACDDLWPTRSFHHDFENRVCSVTFSVLDQLFPCLPQIITTIEGVLHVNFITKFQNFNFSQMFLIFSTFTLKKNLQFCLHTKTTNPYRIPSFLPQIPFLPPSFWVQFSVASSTSPSIFRPRPPQGQGVSQTMASSDLSSAKEGYKLEGLLYLIWYIKSH